MLIPDLSNCEKEPIHVPGKIQRHGFLIAVDPEGTVTHCSANVSDFLPLSADRVLKKSLHILDNFFHSRSTGPILHLITSLVSKDKCNIENPYVVEYQENFFNLIISRLAGGYLLEFEKGGANHDTHLDKKVNKCLSLILANTGLRSLLTVAAKETRRIIAFDRVMVYKFHKDGHGEVVAEDKDERLPSFLGLHYPASDIPKQARELYKINLVRYIGDVNDNPSPILTSNNDAGDLLDLTHSVLRAVSPIHIQYLKNMKVASSFSISLIHEGSLWGLIACHNSKPGFIEYRKREAANLIGKVLSSTLSFQQQGENQQKKHDLRVAVETLAKQLSRYSIETALFAQQTTLIDAVNASAAVLVMDGEITSSGDAPPATFISNLVDWLAKNSPNQTYITDHLASVFVQAQFFKEKASGLLAIRITKDNDDYLLWFRPEVISTIDWAGNPNQPAEYSTHNDVVKISPRHSFKKWTQEVAHTSDAWEQEDIQSGLYLKEEVASALVRKAVETRKRNEQLNEAYKTLDAFSYTISHDLKNPLTTISAYSQLLKENFNLDEDAQAMVTGILSGTLKMKSMIKHILNYSRIGKTDIAFIQINMATLIEELRQDLLISTPQSSVQIHVGETPKIFAEKTMAFQVFSNLLTNAVKYSSKSQNAIVKIEGVDLGDKIKYSINDNGIGIHPSEQENIFKLFTRSNSARDYEGSGVGLSIVKRIMEKHDGEIWVESDGKNGSTFHVTFRKPKAGALLELQI